MACRCQHRHNPICVWKNLSKNKINNFPHFSSATVVQSLRRFWVKSVLSVGIIFIFLNFFQPPLPPCAVRDEFGPWQSPMPTVPPPTGNFKLETFQVNFWKIKFLKNYENLNFKNFELKNYFLNLKIINNNLKNI